MILFSKISALTMLIFSFCACAAMAQSADRFDSPTPMHIKQTERVQYVNTDPITPNLQGATMGTIAPSLQGATMGTIGPSSESTNVQGIMTAGTVQVNSLPRLEAALNLVAIVALILGHILGIYYLVKTYRLTIKTPGLVFGGLAKGFTFISVGLISPMFINWALNAIRDAQLL